VANEVFVFRRRHSDGGEGTSEGGSTYVEQGGIDERYGRLLSSDTWSGILAAEQPPRTPVQSCHRRKVSRAIPQVSLALLRAHDEEFLRWLGGATFGEVGAMRQDRNRDDSTVRGSYLRAASARVVPLLNAQHCHDRSDEERL
jgi:hypothetical protein